MAIVKTRPAPLRVSDEVERWFDQFFNRGLFDFPSRRDVETAWTPALDFAETGEEYVLQMEVPGIPKENLDVTLDGNVVTLSGRREFARDEKTEKYIWCEREEGRFVRSLRLPTAVVESKIQATVDNGVLKVRLPKAKATAKSKIVIS